jgi:hypothetical protein
VGSLDNRLSRLEDRIGPADEAARERRKQQFLEELMKSFEGTLRKISPRVESGEMGLADMHGDSPAVAAAIYVTLRVLGDPAAREAEDILDSKLRERERLIQATEALPHREGSGMNLVRWLVNHYVENLGKVRNGT